MDTLATRPRHGLEHYGGNGIDVRTDVPPELDSTATDLLTELEDPILPDGESVVVDERFTDPQGDALLHLVRDMFCAAPPEARDHRRVRAIAERTLERTTPAGEHRRHDVALAKQRRVATGIQLLSRRETEPIKVGGTRRHATVEYRTIGLFENYSGDGRPQRRFIEFIEQVGQGDFALALDQEVDLGTTDRLVRVEVNVRSSENDSRIGVHAADKLTREDDVNQSECHGSHAYHVRRVTPQFPLETFVGERIGLRVQHLDDMPGRCFDVARELKQTKWRIESAVPLDDGRVLANEFVEAWWVDEEDPERTPVAANRLRREGGIHVTHHVYWQKMPCHPWELLSWIFALINLT